MRISYWCSDVCSSDLGQAAGVFHFDDLACAADMVVGTVRAGLRMLLSETRESHYIESMSKLLLLALGVVRADAHRISYSSLPVSGAANGPRSGGTLLRRPIDMDQDNPS